MAAEPWSPGGDPAGGPFLLLAVAATAVERELIDDWTRTGAADVTGVEVLDIGARTLPDRLARGDDPLVTPVRVVWLPPDDGGDRRTRVLAGVAAGSAHLPVRRLHQRLLRFAPDLARVVAGRPARVSELRARFGETAAAEPDFAAYVARQAVLTLERAERAVVGDRYKVPRLVVDEITTSWRFRQEVGQLAARLGLGTDEVAARAVSALHELVAVQGRLTGDLFSGAMRPLHARAFTVGVDEGQVERLRALNRRTALVFLPSHRSYVDSLVLGDVLARRDFPRNHVMGGANLAFWPMGSIARRAGVVFIRRSFGKDEIYKMAVQEYFGYLTSKRFNLEWYLEGGRSRTGKLRPPRYGLLRYLAGALDAGWVQDVALVPVSITYDHLNEVSAMAAEQGGSAKQKEGLGWLARYFRSQRQPSGTAQVRFAEPFELRGRLAGTPPGSEGRRLALQKVAFEVADGINKATPVMVNALVTLTLLGVRDRALTLDQVRRVLTPVLDYVGARGLPATGLDLVADDAGLRSVLAALTADDVVTTYAGGTEPVYAIEPGHHLVAAYYRNNAIHWFVTRAIVELGMLHVAEHPGEDLAAAGWADSLRLRDLLKYEFFFPDKETFRSEVVAELELIDPRWQDHAADVEMVSERLAGTGVLMAHRVLRSFVDAQLVVAEQLVAQDVDRPLDESRFLASCAGVGRQMVLQGRLHGAESVSRELFEGALKLAANRGLVAPGDDLRGRREAFAAEIRDVVDRVVTIAGIDAAVRRTTGAGR